MRPDGKGFQTMNVEEADVLLVQDEPAFRNRRA